MYAVPTRSIPAITNDNMEIVYAVPIQSYSPQLNGSEVDSSGQKHAKSCHQCRQIREFPATCKNQRNGKPCVLGFCRKCLERGYGEMIEEVYFLNDWVCPRCRGICHCSVCMKSRDQQAIGDLFRTAKASGFNSVSEMLSSQGLWSIKEDTLDKLVVDQSRKTEKENSQGGNKGLNVDPEKTKNARQIELSEVCNDINVEWKRNANDKLKTKVAETHTQIDGPEAWGANDYFFDPTTFASYNFLANPFIFDFKATCQILWDGNRSIGDSNKDTVNTDIDIEQLQKVGKCAVKPDAKITNEEIPLPPVTEMTKILDVEFQPEDVGNALQFLEFCRVFGKVLDIQNGEPEAILQSLIHKPNLQCEENTLAFEFQIKLLTRIVSNSGIESSSLTGSNGNNSWLKVLEELITKSKIVLKEFPMDWLNEGISGYYEMNLSKKLSLLNFICDEALATMKLRSYIDDKNVKFAQKKKEAKCKVVAAKEKEKSLKKKLQDEMEKATISNGASHSISEPNEHLLKMKSEADKAHTEFLEAKSAIPKRKYSDVVRTEPEFFDSNGQAFWKLKSYNDEYALLTQDITLKLKDAPTSTDEKWFYFAPEHKDEIDMYISSRDKRKKLCRYKKGSKPQPQESRQLKSL